MGLKIEQLRYEADGLSMLGHLAWDDALDQPRPAVLVFPEAFGLGEHAKERAERLATEFGFVALACDLHGNGETIESLDEVMPLITPLRTSSDKVRDRVCRPLEVLAVRPEVDAGRMAAIGFCFGGTMSYELALAGADIKAAIGFHSGLEVTSPQDSGQIKGKIMALIGADDPGITSEQRAAFETMLRTGGVDWQMHLYGGVVHSFTSPEADLRGMPDFLRYDAVADDRSWKHMALLLNEVFQ
ncbi:dienelactone hydrolase family protein [Rhizorhapis sp. SPR117]|uniref:dienelactone hydrolase family protein n=1 Tax=Rhizorhapis sp. SPR117 TaxID=2912611 RepID=UPI001F174A1C|nr:dienelactone hydrolase family protein [Rhizorhapis sp. SPR117]